MCNLQQIHRKIFINLIIIKLRVIPFFDKKKLTIFERYENYIQLIEEKRISFFIMRQKIAIYIMMFNSTYKY